MGVNSQLVSRFNSVLNVKVLVGAFNQEKALIGTFSVIVKTDGSFAALVPTLLLLLSPHHTLPLRSHPPLF